MGLICLQSIQTVLSSIQIAGREIALINSRIFQLRQLRLKAVAGFTRFAIQLPICSNRPFELLSTALLLC